MIRVAIGEIGMTLFKSEDGLVDVTIMVAIDRDDFAAMDDEQYYKHLEEACRRCGEYLDDRLRYYRRG